MLRLRRVLVLVTITVVVGASYTAWSYSQMPTVISTSNPLPPEYYPAYLNTTISGNNLSFVAYEGSLQSQGMVIPYSAVGHSKSWAFQVSLVSEKNGSTYQSIGIGVPKMHLELINDTSKKGENIPIWGGYSPSVKISLDRLTASLSFPIPQNVNSMPLLPGNYTAMFNLTLKISVLEGPYQLAVTNSVIPVTFPLVIRPSSGQA